MRRAYRAHHVVERVRRVGDQHPARRAHLPVHVGPRDHRRVARHASVLALVRLREPHEGLVGRVGVAVVNLPQPLRVLPDVGVRPRARPPHLARLLGNPREQLGVEPRVARHHPHLALEAAHLQRYVGGPHPAHGGVVAELRGEGRLAHARVAREDGHLAPREAARLGVDPGDPRPHGLGRAHEVVREAADRAVEALGAAPRGERFLPRPHR